MIAMRRSFLKSRFDAPLFVLPEAPVSGRGSGAAVPGTDQEVYTVSKTKLYFSGALLATAGCSGSVVHSYRTFQSALDRGASCSELYDQRSRYDDQDTLAKMDRDLHRIGCTSPDATRND